MSVIKILLLCICAFCAQIESKPEKKPNIKYKQSDNKKLHTKPSINSKQVLKDFFSSENVLQGSFLHIISKENNPLFSAEPNLLKTGRELSGAFAIDLKKPVCFKWKYLFPYVKQIVKDSNHLLYKDGQAVKTSEDGITVKEINKKKPYIIFQSLPLTFLFDVPVESWINDIEITNEKESHNYISMQLSYKILKQKGILKNLQAEKVQLTFSKHPLCLLQWQFVDHDGNYNQVTLVNISINKKLKPSALKMD